jgi:hypothetical protein
MGRHILYEVEPEQVVGLENRIPVRARFYYLGTSAN